MLESMASQTLNLESSQIVTDPSVIDLGIGQPELDILPKEVLWQASTQLFADSSMKPLNYGHPKGDGEFRLFLSRYLAPHYHHVPHPETFMTTSGASQGLYFLANELGQPGDTILVEEPTYFLALEIFKSCGLKVQGVPTTANGVDLEALESAVKKYKPRFFYTIPTHHNPSGLITSEETREAVIRLAQDNNFTIIADEVYQLLTYRENPPAPYAFYVDKGVVVSVGSFSKILAPGLRLGWLQSSPDILEKLLGSGLLRSGGGLNHFTCCLVREGLKLGLCDRYLQNLRKIFSHRVDVMDRRLQQELGNIVTYEKPRGGYFFWLQLPEELDIERLEKEAADHKTGFRAGPRFSTQGNFQNCIRLSFAHYNENAIDVGIDRLSKAIKKTLA